MGPTFPMVVVGGYGEGISRGGFRRVVAQETPDAGDQKPRSLIDSPQPVCLPGPLID